MSVDVAKLRKRLGLEQPDWARALNVSLMIVKCWEE
jgi:DNA-binding transcriptional regulator YiaG